MNNFVDKFLSGMATLAAILLATTVVSGLAALTVMFLRVVF